MTVIFAIQHS